MANRKSGKKYSKGKSDKNKSSKKNVKISLKKGGANSIPKPTHSALPVLAQRPINPEELKKVHEELKLVKDRLNKLENLKSNSVNNINEKINNSRSNSSSNILSSTAVPTNDNAATSKDNKCSIM